MHIRAKLAIMSGAINEKSRAQHAARVATVQKALREWNDEGRKTKLCTARPGWLAMSLRTGRYKKTMTGIPTHKLGNVISINEEKRTVFVEPNVTMGQITATLMPLGWTLPVLPELDDLTVGGLVCGVGIESSSHKHGLFQHCCKGFELVLASGEVVSCSADNNPELFKAVPWSHGTLGFLVGAELDIVPAKPYVRLEYVPLFDRKTAVETCLESYKNTDLDFIETLIYSRDEMVLMKGAMVDKPEPGKVNAIGTWYKPWFFTHVRSYLEKKKPGVEYIPLRDYYHRHTKSLFWELQDIITFGNDLWFRVLFGWMMPPNHSILKRTQTEELRKLYEDHHVVQDMLVPGSKLQECLDVQDREFGCYPLWLCPMRIFPEDAGFIKPAKNGEEMFIDLGIYGNPSNKDFKPQVNLRNVENYVRSVEGFQMLYADMLQSREEFEEMFDHKLYRKMRKELGCEGAFPEVYDKVCKAARW
ncbi:uncharacterized protein MONBRDRAFT_27834 [Monosiga brevicollis MX1]|uniref:Delta(24)-sterol reductase n=1 Tax=Monosiga brevicollis TaxID=81824 RepID=A9V6L3_MONBE|nr:uncharacterized protein MONBRDRAFT_27834 [Monosiga brevicollis MX1]EDQ86828.1 predicted protein [Monosiga brevicollis MX1]|eukprot:XP_001748373.1 hypothetical protein [Monosiga brevicollis MX1]